MILHESREHILNPIPKPIVKPNDDIIPFPSQPQRFPDAKKHRGVEIQGRSVLIDGIPAADVVKRMQAEGLVKFGPNQAPKQRTLVDQEERHKVLKARQQDCMQTKRAMEKGLNNELLMAGSTGFIQLLQEAGRNLQAQREASRKIYEQSLQKSPDK